MKFLGNVKEKLMIVVRELRNDIIELFARATLILITCELLSHRITREQRGWRYIKSLRNRFE